MSPSSFRFRCFGLLFASFFALSGCATILVSPKEMALNDQYSLDEVDTAMRKAATELNWALVKNEEGFEGTLHVREHEAVVQFNRDKSKISAVYKSSQNLDYDGTNIHRSYHRWVEKFFKTVRRQLSSK